MIGQILDEPVSGRVLGSAVAAAYGALQGAKILRVHDVAETVQSLKVISAFESVN
jgi:dihydropteroate synthase